MSGNKSEQVCTDELVQKLYSYVNTLKAENAALKEELHKALPCKVGDIIYTVTFSFFDRYSDCGDLVYRSGWHISETKVTQKNLYRMCELFSQQKAFFSRIAAEARLIEIIHGN